MPETDSFHSPKEEVHHTNSACRVGQAITPEDRKVGTGGQPHCQECHGLNLAGR